jgi:hypothetical protein
MKKRYVALHHVRKRYQIHLSYTPIALALSRLYSYTIHALVFFDAFFGKIRIGVEFTPVYGCYLVLYGFDLSLNALLDITGHEIYSTVVTSLREIIVTLVVLLAALVAEPSLQDAASLMLGILILFIFWNVGYIAGRGWWRKYYSGMLHTFALRVSTF